VPITAIDELLSVETMTDVFRVFADQGRQRACSRLFQTSAKTIRPDGETASWEEVVFSRGMAPVTGRSSPHPRGKRLGKKKRSCAMAMVKTYRDIPAPELFLERAAGKDVADAEAVLADELLDMANEIANTRELLACAALNGRIEVNEQTVPGSDIDFEVDFKVARLDAANPWDDPQTKIRSEEFQRIKETFEDNAFLEAAQVITEPTLDRYFVQNEENKEFVKESLGPQVLQNMQSNGRVPPWANLGGMTWSFTRGVYQPQDGGPVERYFPRDTAIVLPEDDQLQQVLGWAEGKVFVPAGPVYSEAQSAARSVRTLRGYYAYAKVRDDPIGVRVYAGWYGLPVVLNPRALLVFKVKPQPAPVVAP